MRSEVIVLSIIRGFFRGGEEVIRAVKNCKISVSAFCRKFLSSFKTSLFLQLFRFAVVKDRGILKQELQWSVQ